MPICGYGVCTWMFGGLSLDAVADRVAALHYDGVELLGEFDRYAAAEVKHILTDRFRLTTLLSRTVCPLPDQIGLGPVLACALVH